MQASYQTLAVGFGLIALAWVGSFSSDVPTLICPMPIIVLIPSFFLLVFYHLSFCAGSVIPALLFFAWNPGLFRGKGRVPKRSWVLLIILNALTVAYFIANWRDGYPLLGRTYTVEVGAVNVLWLVVLWAILYRSSLLSSFKVNLFFHAVLFAWLAWYAFPCLSTLP